MKQLDADKTELIDKNGNKAERDIIQFVKFIDYVNDPLKLAEEVLMEIPTQIEQYYRVYKRFVGIKDAEELEEKERQKLIEEKGDALRCEDSKLGNAM